MDRRTSSLSYLITGSGIVRWKQERKFVFPATGTEQPKYSKHTPC